MSIPGPHPENLLALVTIADCRHTPISPAPPPSDADPEAGVGAAAARRVVRVGWLCSPHQWNSRSTGCFVLKYPRGLINSAAWREPRWPKKAKTHIQLDPRAKGILKQTS